MFKIICSVLLIFFIHNSQAHTYGHGENTCNDSENQTAEGIFSPSSLALGLNAPNPISQGINYIYPSDMPGLANSQYHQWCGPNNNWEQYAQDVLDLGWVPDLPPPGYEDNWVEFSDGYAPYVQQVALCSASCLMCKWRNLWTASTEFLCLEFTNSLV